MDSSVARQTFSVIVVLVLVYSLYIVKSTVFIFLASVLFAYLLLPAVDAIHKKLRLLPWQRRYHRLFALIIVYILLFTFLAITTTLLGSVILDQASKLAQKIPSLLKPEALHKLPLPGFLKPWSAKVLMVVQDYVQEHAQEILSSASSAGRDFVGVMFSLILILIMPIISFYCLKDGRLLIDKILSILAPDERSLRIVRAIASDTDLLLAHYMRSLVLLWLVSTCCLGLLFAAFGVPYGVLMAVLCGLLEFIPILGPVVGGTITLLVAVFSGYDLWEWLILALLCYRAVVDYIIYPALISSQISLHPLFVMFGVFAGEQLAGIPGAFFALPALAMVRILFRHMVLRQRVNSNVNGDVELSEINESVDDADLLGAHDSFPVLNDLAYHSNSHMTPVRRSTSVNRTGATPFSPVS